MAIAKQPACCRRRMIGEHEELIIETAAGQHITLKDGQASVLIEDASGNSIHMENGRVTVSSTGKLVLEAPIVEINGPQVVVNAPLLQCSGMVQADTVTANSVAAASYTPGAGNV